jgi:hypothetical protein
MQELLEFAGTLNMSEGNYLKVANALRDVFPKLDEQAPTLQWEQTLPVGEFRMILSNFIYSTGLVRIIYNFTTCKELRGGRSSGGGYESAIGCNIVYEYTDKRIKKKTTFWDSMIQDISEGEPRTIQITLKGVEYTYTVTQYYKDAIEVLHQTHLMSGNSEESWNEEDARIEEFGGAVVESDNFHRDMLRKIQYSIRRYCQQIQICKDRGLH